MSLPRILVVDDDARLLRAIQRLAEERFDVVGVNSANEALFLITTQPFHAIVSDVEMPHFDGLEFFNRLKLVRPALAIRLGFITGRVQTDDLPKEVPLLPKPFSSKEFAHFVDGLLAVNWK